MRFDIEFEGSPVSLPAPVRRVPWLEVGMGCANGVRFFLVLVIATFWIDAVARGATRTWIGGSNNWDSSTSNWSPADEPDSNDDAVFNSPDFVTMTINQTLEGLTLSNGASLSTGTQSLNVSGTIDLDDASTSLTVHTNALLAGTPPLVSVDADDIIITGGAEFFMANDVMIFDSSTTGGSDADTVGVVTVGSGSTFNGNGRLLLNNSISSQIVLFQNNGTLSASSFGNAGFTTSETLTLDAPDPDARIDLDGASGSSTVNVFRGQTLDMNIRQSDDFDGTINTFASSTLDFQFDWLLNGTMNVQSGFIAGTPPFVPDQPAGITVVTGGAVTMSESDSQINVVHNDGTLQFDAPLIANDGVIDNNGHLIFNADATIGSGVNFFMEFDADMTVNATVTVNDADWNWDDNGGSNNDLTINDNGTLNANITAAGASTWTGDMHIVGGTLNVQGDNNNWEQTSGDITFEGSSLGVIGGDQFSLTGGTMRVLSGANGDINSTTFWDAGTLDVDGELELIGGVDWNGTTVIGDGVLEQEGNAVVSANTTIAVDTYDWDQSATLVLPGVIMTVDVGNIDRGNDTFNSNSITVNGGTLSVDVTDGSWTLGSGAELHFASPGPEVSTLTSTGTELVVNNGGVIRVSAQNALSGVAITLEEGSELRLDGPLSVFDSIGAFELAGGDVVETSGSGTFRVRSPGLRVTDHSSITATSFLWDGGDTTIEAGASLAIDVDDFEGDLSYDNSKITINSGTLFVDVVGGWQMLGDLEFNHTGVFGPMLQGDPVAIGGNVDVNGTGRTDISASASFLGSPLVSVDAGSRLFFRGGLLLLGEVEFAGDGTIAFDADSTVVTNPLTINMPNGIVDLDGEFVGSDTLQIQQPLTLNVGAIDSDINVFDNDTIEIDPSGLLSVELPGSNGWVMSGTLNLNGNDDGTFAEQLDGDLVELRGTTNVTDWSQTDARVVISGEVNIAAGGNLRLLGGTNTSSNRNRIEGGVINGPGTLSADDGKSLVGFGAINADIAFSGPIPRLLADDGELVINGAILDVGTLGTFDDDGILNVTNPWNTSSTSGVDLNGGELRGATMTVSSSVFSDVSGHGLIRAPVINEGTISSSVGTLTLLYTPFATDLDGTSNEGELSAAFSEFNLQSGTNVASPIEFHGTIRAFGGGTFTVDNMNLDFTSSSELILNDGTFAPRDGANTQGTVTVDGVSTINSAGPFRFSFESGSTTTINEELRLVGTTEIDAGASFSGAGSLVNLGTLILDDGANVGVRIVNRNLFRPADAGIRGQAIADNFEQTLVGRSIFELEGTESGEFDQLLLTGDAVLDGTLFLSLLGNFDPVLGDTFTLLTAASVTGTFAAVTTNLAPLAPGLGWEIVYNPNAVQARVVANLTADADLDGDVDGADFLILQRNDPSLIPDWQAQYGLIAPIAGVPTSVPEPSSLALVACLLIGLAQARCGR